MQTQLMQTASSANASVNAHEHQQSAALEHTCAKQNIGIIIIIIIIKVVTKTKQPVQQQQGFMDVRKCTKAGFSEYSGRPISTAWYRS
eukprot:3529389-Rhodomonas_salina.1